MRSARTMLSSAILRLFITEWSACVFRFASTSERSAVTETSITTEKSPAETIISTSVNPLSPFIFISLDSNLPCGFDNNTRAVASRRFEYDAAAFIERRGVRDPGNTVRAYERIRLRAPEQYIEPAQSACLRGTAR